MSNPNQLRTPLWMTAIIILAALPVVTFPAMLSTCPPELKVIAWVYPFVTLAAAWLTWQCYPQRPALAWILVAITILTHCSMWVMVTQPLY